MDTHVMMAKLNVLAYFIVIVSGFAEKFTSSRSGVLAEKDFLQTERSESISFECSAVKTTGCELYKYTNSKNIIVNRNRTNDIRFQIRDSDSCIVDMNSAKMFDSGEYHCITDKEYDVYYLQVKRPASKILYNNKLWTNNSQHLIDPTERKFVHFTCITYLQYNRPGTTTFIWSENNETKQHEYKIKRLFDDLLECQSNVQVQFELGEKEKEIKCQIHSGSETETLIGVFGIPYATTAVSLVDKSGCVCGEQMLLEGETKQVTCKGNGYPLPNDYLIAKVDRNGVWKIVDSRPSFNVSESGTYVCEARNYYENGTRMKNYVVSNKLSFRNYDREIAVVNRALSDVNNDVVELHKKRAVLTQSLTHLSDDLSELFRYRGSTVRMFAFLNNTIAELHMERATTSRILSKMSIRLDDISKVQQKILKHLNLRVD